MDLKSTIRSARTTLANRRTEKSARRRLEAELAAFATAAERAELEIVLERHTPEEGREVRAILSRQAMERQLAGHRY